MADHVEAVTVEQCDRDAAAALFSSGNEVPMILNGAWDDHRYVQAFARHRQSALTEMRDALREAHENLLLHEQTGKAHHIAYAFDAIDAALSGSNRT